MNLFLPVVIALSLAAAPKTPPKKDPPKEAQKDTMKDLLKDAASAPKEGVDGGAALVNGIDISKLPFSPDSVKKIVLSFQPQIQSCYEETLAAKDKALEGTLKTSFVITPDGYVKKASVNAKTSSLKDPRLHGCVVAVLSSMNFPPPNDGKDHPIDFPFNLKAVR